VHAVDTTAAGDAFNAGFAVGLMRGFTVARGAVFASAVAAISVTRHGAQSSMPTLAEVKAFVNERLGPGASLFSAETNIEDNLGSVLPGNGT
jgi:ribokinase